MSPRALEVDHEKKLVDGVKDMGGIAIKLPANLYRGIPDRLILLPGPRFYFTELKRDKRTKTRGATAVHQEEWREFLIALGFKILRLEGIEEVKQFLEEQQLL